MAVYKGFLLNRKTLNPILKQTSNENNYEDNYKIIIK